MPCHPLSAILILSWGCVVCCTDSLFLSGNCTVQVSSFREGLFPFSYNSSKSWFGITNSEYAPGIHTFSPTSFFVNAKAASAKDMQTEISIDALSVVTNSDPLPLGLRGMLYRFSVLVW